MKIKKWQFSKLLIIYILYVFNNLKLLLFSELFLFTIFKFEKENKAMNLTYKLSNILFLDIETVPQEESCIKRN
jgi:hypothetical protein